MKRFVLNRKEDITGVSGTGVVAEGVVFTTGTVILQWLTTINSIVIYPALENVLHIHGHGGSTVLEWVDT